MHQFHGAPGAPKCYSMKFEQIRFCLNSSNGEDLVCSSDES